MPKTSNDSHYLLRGLLQCYYWYDEGLQNSLAAAGYPGLSRTKSMLMVNIANGITRPSDLARNIGITRQAIQQTLVEMERDGLVTMIQDPNDGRAKIVKFSRRGVGIGKAAFAAIDEIEQELTDRLGAKTLEQLRDTLFRDWGPVLHSDHAESDNGNSRGALPKARRG